MSNVKYGFLVPLDAQPTAADTVEKSIHDAKPHIDAEEETKQWYGVRLADGKYAVFDAFATEAGREAHAKGKVATKFKAISSTVISNYPPNIARVEILASLVRPSTAAKVGLYVPIVAKPETAEAVKDILIKILPMVEEEPGTLQWYAFRKSETEFGILDTAAGESERDAHLRGKAAEALKGAKDLLVERPNIQKCDILALKVVV